MAQGRFAVGVALLVVASTVAAGALAAPTAGGTSGVESGGNQASVPAALQEDGGEANASQANASQGSWGCNYAQLYDRTIDSVASIRTGSGIGSGFVYQTFENGTSYVVTNAHVVGDADTVVVQLAGDESRTGEVIGHDQLSDLAVVRVDETPEVVDALPVADRPPEQGRAVAALGNPFGLDETITHGIVSGVNRSMPTTRGYSVPNVVQTDAPISPGNSGGPLVTCEGTVVGVNTAGIAAQGAENIGFAISSTLIEQVVPALIEDGEYEYSYLGVATTPITPPIAEANDLNATQGLYVVRTAAGSPAADVLQGATDTATVDGYPVPVGGDVIVAIDGREVSSAEGLSSYLVTETSPGEEVTLTVVRDGERQQVTLTLDERPAPATVMSGSTERPSGQPPR